ncbi:acetamidase/formamidase family protein [Arthrobacter sp. zg-Y179]|uniref:acetamidase/formamidase family protein n=1 Tax=Arthrobacter sp. zg-Y179 TaxID=2894188 RepID=UPI002F4226DD
MHSNNSGKQFQPVEYHHHAPTVDSGTSVTLDGEQRYLHSHLSYQRACLHAIDYLTKFGHSPEQAYLPASIFDFDVRPSAPFQITPGIGAPRASRT